jgi:hypothetical protein
MQNCHVVLLDHPPETDGKGPAKWDVFHRNACGLKARFKTA